MEEGKIVSMGFRIDEALSKKFKSVCMLEGTTVKEVLTRAVNDFLAQVEKKNSE
ncbi:MAG: hypothetical protein IJP96_13405 [Synergistaceae bacterium]|nr:hypothetical protein [Synergistaceae bacterium]